LEFRAFIKVQGVGCDWLWLNQPIKLFVYIMATRLLGIERPPGFCSVHFMLGVAFTKVISFRDSGKIGVVADLWDSGVTPKPRY